MSQMRVLLVQLLQYGVTVWSMRSLFYGLGLRMGK